jgi:large subunit ribosomal protein L4
MASIDMRNLEGDVVGQIELDDAIFSAEVKQHLLWEVVRWQRARTRAGTHLVKTKSERSGTGKKPFKQKGTGNARQGSTRSVQFVGGGRVHGPQPRDYSFSMNKKARVSALRSALSLRAGDAKIVVVKDFNLEAIKTGALATILEKLSASDALVVDTAENTNLRLSARNLAGVETVPPEGLNVYSILNHGTLVLTEEAAKAVERRLA